MSNVIHADMLQPPRGFVELITTKPLGIDIWIVIGYGRESVRIVGELDLSQSTQNVQHVREAEI